MIDGRGAVYKFLAFLRRGDVRLDNFSVRIGGFQLREGSERVCGQAKLEGAFIVEEREQLSTLLAACRGEDGMSDIFPGNQCRKEADVNI